MKINGICKICGGKLEEIKGFSGDFVDSNNVIGYRCISCGMTWNNFTQNNLIKKNILEIVTKKPK